MSLSFTYRSAVPALLLCCHLAACKTVSVSGAVKNPGKVNWHKGMTVYNAVEGAGGFTDESTKHTVAVDHVVSGMLLSEAGSKEVVLIPDERITVLPARN